MISEEQAESRDEKENEKKVDGIVAYQLFVEDSCAQTCYIEGVIVIQN